MYVSINNIMCNIEVASYRLIAYYYTIKTSQTDNAKVINWVMGSCVVSGKTSS